MACTQFYFRIADQSGAISGALETDREWGSSVSIRRTPWLRTRSASGGRGWEFASPLAQPKEVLQAALGRAFKLLAIGSAAGLLLGILPSQVLAFIVDQATPGDPVVLAGVVVMMLLRGLLATWIPARRALSVDPWVLLREE